MLGLLKLVGKYIKARFKVALNSGEKAFDLAIEVLKETQSMGKLIYNPNLTIDLPTTENDIKSKGYLPTHFGKTLLRTQILALF